jgi:hypothetical protein
MESESLQLVKCRIARSGFSSERVFTISLPGQAEYMGASPLAYCYDSRKHPLQEDQPKEQQEVVGHVAARVVKTEPKRWLISVPSGDVLWVDPTTVTPQTGRPPHVPVES